MKKKITSPFLRIAVLLLALVLVADVCVPGFAVFAEDNTSITGDAAAVEGDNTSIDGEDIVVLNDKQNPETPVNPEEKQSEETPVNPEENGNQPEETPEEQPVSCQEGCEGETCTVEGCTCACHLDNTSTDGEETPAEDAQNPDEAEGEGEPEEENPDESEEELPEEETADPVQELVDRLLACGSLGEMNAMMESFTDEDRALLEQISEAQNAALSAKMEELGAYEATELVSRQDASVFYVKSPTSNPDANDTSAFGSEVGIGTIDVDGLTWVKGNAYIGDVQNSYGPNLISRVTKMGNLEQQSNGSWRMPNTSTYSKYFTEIWNYYGDTFKKQYGINSKDEITAIYLTPYKASKGNYTGKKSLHIDCTISLETSKLYTANFWVLAADGSKNTVVEQTNYKIIDEVPEDVVKTTKAPTSNSGSYPEETTVNGVTYKFVGWYNEANWDAINQRPVENATTVTWNDNKYTPNSDELSDGAVNFYAYYTPVKKEAKITIKKVTTGNMAEYSREFDFTVSGSSVAASNKTFRLKNGEQTTITVNIGDNIEITETDTAYVESYQIDNAESKLGNSATITDIQADTTIVFTNTLEATPDTGIALDIAPYVILLATVAVGFVLMAGKKRYI